MISYARIGWLSAGAILAPWAAVQAAQTVAPDTTYTEVAQGASVSVVPIYGVSAPQDASETGLGLRMHFNSSALTLDSITGALSNAVPIPPGGTMNDLQPIGAQEPDTPDHDGDPETDTRVVIGWVDVNAGFPAGSPPPVPLFTANFTASGSFTGNTAVKFTASSTSYAAGTQAAFETQQATICINGPGGDDCSVIPGDANGDGQINIFDVIAILNHIDAGTGQGTGADCTQDGSVNIFDVICTLNLI